METDMALSWLSELGKRVFGSMDGLFYTLVAFVVIDYITGVCVAIHNKQLSSDVGAHGIAKKIAIFALVSLRRCPAHCYHRVLYGQRSNEHYGKRGKGRTAFAAKASELLVSF